MPYFIFQINNHREYLLKGEFEAYQDARQKIRMIRSEKLQEQSNVDHRMIFSQTSLEGQELLRKKREKQPSEDNF
ncbi:MAG: hypothetical protein ACI9FD_003314 [Gammaproteobacteria bacterium]|jgi:hypothetical protein